MVTEQDLHEKYAGMQTDDLLKITANKSDYTDLAVSVALGELKKRKVPEGEIKSYKSAITHEIDKNVLDNYLFDLNIFQKLEFFTVIVPLIRKRFRIHYDFISTGYVLKSQQGNYYLVSGTCFLIGSAIVSNISGMPFLAGWITGFVLSFLFDIGYNKEQQITALQKKVEEGKNPADMF